MAVNGTYYSGIGVKEVREIIKQYREDAADKGFLTEAGAVQILMSFHQLSR